VRAGFVRTAWSGVFAQDEWDAIRAMVRRSFSLEAAKQCAPQIGAKIVVSERAHVRHRRGTLPESHGRYRTHVAANRNRPSMYNERATRDDPLIVLALASAVSPTVPSRRSPPLDLAADLRLLAACNCKQWFRRCRDGLHGRQIGGMVPVAGGRPGPE